MPSAQFDALLAMFASRPQPSVPPSLAEQRAGIELIAAQFPPPTGAQSIAVDANGVPSDWVMMPASNKDRVVMYLHGGGYVVGSRKSHRGLAARIAQEAQARVLLLDYRLAPEHPFPAAVVDAVKAYRWLLAQDVHSRRIAIAGDSAGGGLTLATLASLKQQGVPLPSCAVCLSPWTDLEGTGPSAQPGGADDPMLTLDGLRNMGKTYASAQTRDPLASPLHADPAGFPPLLIQVGTRELLLDDSIRFAERAALANVPVKLQVEPGMIHVWQLFGDIPEALAAVKQIGEFIRSAIS